VVDDLSLGECEIFIARWSEDLKCLRGKYRRHLGKVKVTQYLCLSYTQGANLTPPKVPNARIIIFDQEIKADGPVTLSGNACLFNLT